MSLVDSCVNMYKKSTKIKYYFIPKFRIFFFLFFNCFLLLFFSGSECKLLELFSTGVGERERIEESYSNNMSRTYVDNNIGSTIGHNINYAEKGVQTFSPYMDIEMEEYEEYEEHEKEVYSLKKSEIVFLGTSDVKKQNVSFSNEFIDLLSEKYIDEFSCGGTLDDLLNYITLYYHSRTHDESFVEKKKIKVSPLVKVEQVIDDVANAQGYNLMRLHLFSRKEDVIDSLFEHYIGREMKSIVDYGIWKIFFNEFNYKVQLGIYHKYDKQYLQVYSIANNDTVLLVYDVNNKSSFDDLNMLIDYFSKNNSKHIFFILGDQSSSAGDVDILGEKPSGAGTDSNEIFDDNYVSDWCKKKEVEINTAGEETNAEENKINI